MCILLLKFRVEKLIDVSYKEISMIKTLWQPFATWTKKRKPKKAACLGILTSFFDSHLKILRKQVAILVSLPRLFQRLAPH